MDGLPTKGHISVTTGPGSAAPTFTQKLLEGSGGGLHTLADADTTSVGILWAQLVRAEDAVKTSWHTADVSVLMVHVPAKHVALLQ